MSEQETTTPSGLKASGDAAPTGEDDEAARAGRRENARRVLHATGVPEILRTMNHEALKGRGTFEEYDSGVIFRWGGGYSRRHIWVDVTGDVLRIRLREHLRCRTEVPVCNGEYHSFPAETWGDRSAIERELWRAYERPVAETSDD